MRKNWASEEKSKLIEYYNKKFTIPQIARIMNRSAKSIESKIWTLKFEKVIKKK